MDVFDKYATEHNIYRRVGDLYTSETPDHQKAEQIDRDITRATQYAENKCRKLRRDYWSIPIHTICRELVVWNALKYRKKKNLDNQAVFVRAAGIGIAISEETTFDEINDAICRLRQQIRDLHDRATELRDQHLLNLMNLARELQDKERTKMIETIRNQERRHRGYGLLEYFRSKAVRFQAVNEIRIPSSWTKQDKNDTSQLEDPKKLCAQTLNRTDISDDPNWVTITTPSEILEYCRMRN